MADSGARTLLVECDMRRPAFASVFGVGNEGGLSLFLSGHVPRVKMYPTSSEKLYVVTSGPSAPNPVALLNSQKMSAFLADMTASFDFVILDTPPVLPLADARVLGAKAEGVVLVVRAGYTSRQLLRRVCSVLDASGANLLGAVLKGAESEGLGSSYYRYYPEYYEADQTALVVDYKAILLDNDDSLAYWKNHYLPQLRVYCEVVKDLFRLDAVEGSLLFLDSARLEPILKL